MKVLHLWKGTTDQAGGGGMLMGQLHRELRQSGVDSRILAEFRAPGESEEEVALLPRWRLDGALRRVVQPLGFNDIHRLSSFGIARHPFFREADVVHLHGSHSGFLNYLALPALAREKPMVMTLHDVWAMTGHCAVNFDCERWRSGCGSCPYLEAHPRIARDATATEWRLKRWAFQRAGMTIVAISQPLLDRCRESLLAGLPMRLIVNGVDTEVLVPQDKTAARARLGLPTDKRIVLFSARQLMDPGKGWDLLVKALNALEPSLRARIEVATMGWDGARLAQELPVPAHDLGFRREDREKALVYAAADILVAPSRAEALSLTIAEAMACARPQVAFNTGGIPQLLRHRRSGYLARYQDAEDLAHGISWLLADPERLTATGEAARRAAERDVSRKAMTARYLSLYEELVSSKVPASTERPAVQGVTPAP